MKKTVLLLLLGFALTLTLSAQTASSGGNQPQVECRTAFIDRILSNSLGFRVIYFKVDGTTADFYVPRNWLAEAAGRAQIVYTSGPSIPYFSLFRVNGEFSYVRIYADRNENGISWGSLNITPEISQAFQVEAIDIEF